MACAIYSSRAGYIPIWSQCLVIKTVSAIHSRTTIVMNRNASCHWTLHKRRLTRDWNSLVSNSSLPHCSLKQRPSRQWPAWSLIAFVDTIGQLYMSHTPESIYVNRFTLSRLSPDMVDARRVKWLHPCLAVNWLRFHLEEKKQRGKLV